MADRQFTLLNLIDKWCGVGQHFVPRVRFSTNAAKKDGLQVRCKECYAKYRLRNKERLDSTRRRYVEQNKELIRARRREQYWRDPEMTRAMKMARYYANQDAVLATRRIAYHANPSHYREQRRRWSRDNPEKAAMCDRRKYEKIRDTEAFKIASRRRGKLYHARHPDKVRVKAHRRRSVNGVFTSEQWIAKCEYWGWRCYLCKCGLTLNTASIDHRKPLIKGGLNWISNIAPACRYCNAAKRDRSEAVYRDRMLAGQTKINPQSLIQQS